MRGYWLVMGLWWAAISGCTINPAKLSDDELRVAIFLGTECPFSQNYTHTLNQLYAKYGSSGLEFIGYFPEKSDNHQEIKAFAEYYQIEFDLQTDHQRQMTRKLKATVTPEVFLISNQGVLYSGKIDNWAVDLGKRRKVITEHYLEDAMTAVIAGKPVPVTRTDPVGCFISSADH